MSAARVGGRGVVEISGRGLVVQGRILGADSPIPSWASLVVLGLGLLVSLVVPNAERILTPATILVVGGILWFRYRSEFGQDGSFDVTWADVEHVVRLPSAPHVVAVVLARPLAGPGTPEQFFFAPTEGIDLFVAALRAAAPPHLTWDLESAERPLVTGSEAEEGEPESE